MKALPQAHMSVITFRSRPLYILLLSQDTIKIFKCIELLLETLKSREKFLPLNTEVEMDRVYQGIQVVTQSNKNLQQMPLAPVSEVKVIC